ncbi:related to small s protein [Fusarium oxysporum]|uniref:Related to small s protein n=1 Tax=Fusarium oxysporum TaxID=5507 RepID=A0A2H3SR70_FUSOX|nr:related to small s protein [Fusarium oxysporum]
MAEVAGLALGVLGLAGLIGAFKDTIDLFNTVVDMRHMGRQYQVLDIKLDIEKTLLLQWADRVKLLQNDHDSRLDEPNTQTLVLRILGSIRSILTDTNQLQQRYGLRLENGTEAPTLPPISTSTSLGPDLSELPSELFSGSLPLKHVTSGQQRDSSQSGWRFSQQRMKSFMRRLEALPVPVQGQATTTSVAQKTRWVIRDKQKFEILVQDLAELTAKLDQVVPPSSSETARSMIQSDIELIKKDVRKLLLFQEAAANHEAITQSTQQNLDRMRQTRILNTLWFSMINDRSESISKNHRDTLQWAIEGSNNTESWHDLPSWLLNGSGIYWVSGKAGSGKSTLMKFVFGHQRTTSILSQWANRGQLLICHYFFSNLGTDLQKSQAGLSRTLLY